MGMIRKLLQLAVFLLIANAVYQAAPVSWHYYEFKDAVQELALFSQKSPDNELIDRVMVLAEEHNIPLEREYVQVRRGNGQLVITAAYIETMTFLPGYQYAREFDVQAKAFDAAH
jgi:hypothetical protein